MEPTNLLNKTQESENTKTILESILQNFEEFQQFAIDIAEDLSIIKTLQKDDREAVFHNSFCLHSEIRNYEIRLIKMALRLTNGHQTKAAKLLGLNKTTLNAKIKHFEIKHRGSKY